MKTLYLGPKVEVSLPFVPFYVKKLVTILVTTIFSISLFSQELVFRNPTLESGNNGSNGTVYRFNNVTANVDALLKIITRSDNRVRLKDPDYTGSGFDKAFQPRVEYNRGNVSGTVNWWMEFELSFVTRATTNAVNVQEFNLTALDIDGDGQNMREYMTFYKYKNYTLETPTLIAATTVTDGLLSGVSTGTRFLAPQQNFNDVDTSERKVMATLAYQNASKFYFRIGGVHSGLGNSNAGDRMNAIWFKSFSYSAPALMLPVKLASFNAVLQNRQVMLNWSTAQEKNVSHFAIERSTNGTQYNDAALIFTDGNSEVLKSYAHKDVVNGNSSVLYYRLRIVDLDGTATYSQVRMIRMAGSSKDQLELLAFPNPVVSELRITIPENWQNRPVIYELYDNGGRLIKQVTNKNASQTEVVNMRTIGAGNYIIKAYNANQALVQRIVKS